MANGYLVLDVETNALPDYKLPADAPGQPRLAAMACLQVAADLTLEATHNLLVKPDGWSMQPAATAVNGLTDAMLAERGEPVEKSLAIYSSLIKSGRAVIAFNSRHDCKTMRGELRLAGHDDLFELTPNWCVMRAATPVCRILNARGSLKWPKLQEACEFFQVEPPGTAHTALVDAFACLEVARKLVAHGVPIEPMVHYSKAHAAA